MQKTTCKKQTKSLNLSRDLLFQLTLGMTNHTQLKQHANTVFAVDM